MLLCWSREQIVLPDPLKILLHEVVDANLSSRLQEFHQVIKGVVEVREFLLIIIQVVNHKIASNKVKLFFILVTTMTKADYKSETAVRPPRLLTTFG